MSSRPHEGGRADRSTRFHLAVQRNRAVVFPLAAAIAVLLKATVGVSATYAQILLVIAVSDLSALGIYFYYREGLDRRTGLDLDWAWLLIDMGTITYGIHISGGAESIWFPWYLANIAGAAFAIGQGAAALVALGDTVSYVGLLAWRGEIQGADPLLFRSLGLMACLYGASFFFLRGASELQRKRAEVTRLGENERRKVEELTRVTAALEKSSSELGEANLRIRESDRLKSQFLANMSHELRTPLNSIIGFSEILERRLSRRIADDEGRFLDHIHSSGRHLLDIINDILDLSKIEAGKMELVPESLDLRGVANGLSAVMRPLATERRIHFEVEIDDDLPPVVGDRVKIKQILYNLLANAVKFSHEDSVVTLRAFPIRSEGEADAVRIEVEDRGIGIAPADRELIFEAFRQADGTVGRKHQGTGLGLALVRRLVGLHGGRIELQSAVGVGSTFAVVLPLHATPSRPEASPPPVEPTTRPRILVVEDDPTAFESLREMLEAFGYLPLRATDAREAIELARSVRPAAITLDLILPDRDGWEVLRELREDEKTREIPIIVVSMLDNSELGLALGADAYLSKPVDRDELLRHLRTCVPRSVAGTPQLLVIDDDLRLHDLVRGFLAPLGYDLKHAMSGPEGLEAIRYREPDVVLLDLMMEEMDGFEVAATLQEDPATASIPIVVLTAKELGTDDRERLRGRIAALVQKHSAQQQLVSVIEDLVQRRRGGEERV